MKLATLKKRKKLHTQKTWLMRMNQTGGKHAVKGKQKPLLQPSLSKMESTGKRGPFYKCQMSQALSSLPILCTQYGNTGGIWPKGKFQNGRICNRSFPRILVAEFQIRTSYSRTCTEDRRQVGDRKWQVRMMLGTVRLDEQNKYLFSSNITHIKWVKLPCDVFTNPHSWEPIWTYAWKGRDVYSSFIIHFFIQT